MRLTRLLLPITLLAALALTSSAFAADVGWGPPTDKYVVESYCTQLDNDNYRYDYVLWYEEWDTTNTDWKPQPDDTDYFLLEWPSGWGTSGVDDIFVQAGAETSTGSVTLAKNGETNMGSDTGTSDNTNFNGAISKVRFDGFGLYTETDPGPITYQGWRWWFTTNSNTSEQDVDETHVDYHGTGYNENKDAAVRTDYFYNLTNWGSGTLGTDWQTYIRDSDYGSEYVASWAPLTYDGTGGQANLVGYDRPIAWVWIEFTEPPTQVIGNLRDGGNVRGEVLGPTPELNPVFLLMLTLLPAGLLLRKRD